MRDREMELKLNRSIKLINKGRYKEALVLVRQVHQEFPEDYLPIALMGSIYFLEQKFINALPYFELVIVLKPESELASISLFNCYASIHNLDKAMDELLRFVNSNIELKKDHYKPLIKDLYFETDNPQLNKYKNIINKVYQKYF